MHVKIWGKDNCPSCVNAESACRHLERAVKDFSYEVVKLEVDYEVEDFTSHFPYATTVPQIVMDGKHIGGWDQFVKIADDLEFKT
jgi:glutaredoxin